MVENTAGSASALVCALFDGVETDGVEGGVSVENTWGNPWLFKNVCRSLKTDGAWGRIESIVCRMSERFTAASSDVKRLLGVAMAAATSQAESSTARTATPTPSDGVDVAQVVPAHRDVAPGPEDPPGRPEARRR